MSNESVAKKQRTRPTYTLLYHPGIPGRGEYIRLALEASNTPYTDLAVEKKDGYAEVQQACMNKGLESEAGNPPIFAPPALRIVGGRDDGGTLVISQTPNILDYLGGRVGMAGDAGKEDEKYFVAEVALTALDLSNEVHDSHHPVAVALYYEDQKEESLRRAKDLRENRIPKFFSYFARTLKHNAEKSGQGRYLVSDRLTYADTTVWQVLDGLYFAFPKEMAARKEEEEFRELLGPFYDGVKEEKGIKEYLASGRRMEYSMGLFRRYPELDRQ